MGDKLGSWKNVKKPNNFKDLARLLTRIEADGPEALGAPILLAPESVSLRIGITGPPGAGKSTLINALIERIRGSGQTVGVLAVDPSSPFTRGAVLGDRIRYHQHFSDEGVFIRSVGTRGTAGGLSASIYLFARALEAYGLDIVLIETVGVGQTELEIMNVADRVAVVLVPESGDSIQAMKAGILEIADVFVVNKADRPGADLMERELKTWTSRPVVGTVATEGRGVEALFNELSQIEKSELERNRKSPDRLQAEARALLRGAIERRLESKLKAIRSPADIKAVLDDLTI